mmetsp:Transcript_129128/g.252869  ORF Transcript_129128/g.252869 Transcript_129128/m.252869 type:complete len:401 (+) Transcript_129128:3-1205(+)
MTGGLIYHFLPMGKTRHAVIVTDQRLFYVRYRRPSLPLPFLGVGLRIDCFRHDHDVFCASMARTNPGFVHKHVHKTLLREQFLPGNVALQCRFGALQLVRAHGDVLDVYELACALSRNTAEFLPPAALQSNGIDLARCQEIAEKSMTHKSNHLWAIEPRSDDGVLPHPSIQLSHTKEQIVFHTSFKDTCTVLDGCYTHTDVVVTTGRLFLWHRQVYKKWDCQAILYYIIFWRGMLRFLKPPANLLNECAFFTLPSLLSFSTDLSVDPPSWLVPHHQPLKFPCWENLTYYLTFCRSRPDKGVKRFSCCPYPTGPSAHVNLYWRLKNGAFADGDFVFAHTFRPFYAEGAYESDEDNDFTPPDDEEVAMTGVSHEEQVETLRRIMCVTQDQCTKVLDKMDSMY